MNMQNGLIANESELEAFERLPPGERQLTDSLKGVLAETAVTGVIRYQWPLIRPLLSHVLQEQLTKYEAAEHVEVGPARPIQGSSDGSVSGLCERFNKLMWGFESHPWTLQRLCEVLLEPQKQYKRLHKLALAVEKLLVVTGEVEPAPHPGPPPPLSQLTRINEAPQAAPAAAGAAAAAAATGRQGDSDGSGLLAAALNITQAPPQPGGPAAAATGAGQAGAAAAQADAQQSSTAAAVQDTTAGQPVDAAAAAQVAAAGTGGGAAEDEAAAAAPESAQADAVESSSMDTDS